MRIYKKIFLILCLSIIISACSAKKSYFFAVFENLTDGDVIGLRVILDNGKEIGKVVEKSRFGSSKSILKIILYSDYELDKSLNVKYVEPLIGGNFIEVSENFDNKDILKPIEIGDTVIGVTTKPRNVDSVDQKIILDKIVDLTKTIDSVAKKRNSSDQ